MDEIPSCDDPGLTSGDLCTLDPETTACTVPSGDSCHIVGDGGRRLWDQRSSAYYPYLPHAHPGGGWY